MSDVKRRIWITVKQYRDSNPYTEKFYIENLRGMSGERRLQIGFELRDLAISICIEGIRRQFPGISEEQERRELLRRLGYDPERFFHQGDG